MQLRGVCFPRCAFEVIFARNQVFMSTLHVLRCVLVYLLARLKILAFSPWAPNRKRAGRSHLSSGSFHHRNWARWKCWEVANRQDAGVGPGFFACLLLSFRGNIWLEEIVLNVLGLMIHDGKCDHRNWGYYGKEHVQSSCAYHRFYYILVPLPTILG